MAALFLNLKMEAREMNKNLKSFLEVLGVLVITCIIAMTSPFNPWANVGFTSMQEEILDIAHSVREGYLAYVDLGGNYGPVLYEFYGLGYLLTETHVVHFIMELVIIFASVYFLYKSAKLYTSEIFAIVCTAIPTVFGWGALASTGPEMILFFIMSLTVYHVTRQLKYGFLSYHTYLLAIDMTLVIFLQPGYCILWFIILLFFAVMFKVKDIESKDYKSFWMSILEGIVTVSIPMGLYLWYFKNASSFLEQVVNYNFNNMGNLASGLRITLGTPWSLLIVLLLVVIIVKAFKGDYFLDLCCWLGLIAVAVIVISLQGDVNPHSIELLKALYVVPLASAFSFIDEPLGLSAEERKF